ncbi:MAG TPA: phosphatidylinositol mannoside acyltransferase [Propionibacteriaceae bacterium]|jgi:lauroyl/myristoyl acyltransferase|nr:phosphatidylinositol mannoside acyltransferase [Propionibacteriaceae bacterium]
MRVRPEAVIRLPQARRRELLRNTLVRAIYRFGWRVAARLPTRLVAVIISVVSWVAWQRSDTHIRNLRRNLTYATGSPVNDDLLRAAIKSYFRSFYEVLALPAWSATEIRRRISVVNEHVLRDAYAGSGAVVALPHSGNWDLAGAWACVTGMPVTTVVEQLPPDEFAAFLAFRERLGMQVLSHRDPEVLTTLMGAIRRRRVVCLVADRDLARTGVPVSWRGQPITMPAGPALVARRTGAALLPAVCQFTDDGMAIIIGNPIQPRPGRDGLIAMMQQVTDFFADTIAKHPQDWHMMQPFFFDQQTSGEEAR